MPLRRVLVGAVLACVAGRAEAADSRLRVAIPPRAYADALIDLGLQTNVSILGTSSCGSGGRAELTGRYTLDEALSRLLAGAPCRYRIIDPRTVRITVAPPAPPLATAPERDPPRPPSLVAEVVVTATKRPVAMDSLPAGVSAVSGRQIATTGAVDVGRTVGQLAGVLSTNLGPGRDKLLIRGLSDGAFTGRTRSTVGTYLDETPINYNAPDPDLRLVDIDRIEVIRGPQGALYGSGAVAGIYKIVTNRPDLEALRAGVLGGVSWTQGGERSHEIEGYVNLPLVKDRVGVRIVGYRDKLGGYLDDVNLRIADVDQTRRSGGRLALRVEISPAWSFDALAASQTLRSNDTQYISVPVAVQAVGSAPVRPGSRPAPAARSNRIREAHNNDFDYVGATLRGAFEWGAVSSSVSYVHHVFSSQYDATATLSNFSGFNATDLGVYVEANRSDLLVQDLVVTSNRAGRFDWLVGLYGANTVERAPSTLSILTARPTVSTAYQETRKDRTRELALYGEGAYDLGQGWTATLGGRIFESRVHTTAAIAVTLPSGPRFFDQSRTFKGFSPKISLQKEFAGGDLVYALITEGYRPGGFNSSGLLPIRAARTTFGADRLRNYEVGAKFRRLDGRISVRTAAYYDEWSNIQTDRYRTSGLAYVANVGDARIWGLEAEATVDWPFGLSLQVNGLLSNSQIENPSRDFDAPVAGDLPGVPKVSGGILAVYARPLSNDLTLRLIGEASYIGRADLSFDASLASQTDQYLRARLSADIGTEAWRVTAFVNNPFNDAGDTFAYGNPFSFGQVRQVTPQRPRTVGVRVAAAF